jgi:iron complex outermembrane recepter protein
MTYLRVSSIKTIIPMKSLFLSVVFLITTSIFAQETKETVKDTVKNKTTELKEVTVYGNKKQFIKIESDKTTVNVRNNPMLNSGTSLEAVKRIPGVITSPAGGLTLNGKGVAIYIDGAPSSLSGTDLQNYLASLPATAIEKIELIYNPGAAYDANASGSIINIITSTRRMKGVNASFNINYNFNKYQKPSPQILLNGKEKDLSWQTMIGYNYIDSENRSRNGQTFTSFNPDEVLLQKNFAQNTNRNFYARTGLNYRLTKKSNLLFNYNITLANDRVTSDASTNGTGVDFNNNVYFKDKNANNELSLQYKTKLDTLGRTFDVTAYSNFFHRKPTTSSFGENNGTPTFFGGRLNFNLTNYYLKYDFAFPFEKYQLSINTGGKYNSLKVQNNGVYDLNTATNVKFKNRNFFPNVSALYELNQNINISGSFSKKIEQANYNSLDPNNFGNFDQYNTSTGNPFLAPVFFDNYDFKITAFQFAQIGANYVEAKDRSIFILNAEPNELVSTQTFQQFDKFKTLTIYANFPLPLDYFLKGKEEFGKRMNDMDKMNYIFFNISYNKTTTEGYDLSFTPKPVMTYGAQAQFILPWEIRNSMSYFILPGGTWEIYQIEKPIQQFDISFSRDFMNKNLKIGLHCFDVFNSNEINALISSTNLQTNFYQKQDTRTFRVSLTYNFGNLKLQKENTDINVEKKGAGGGFLK